VKSLVVAVVLAICVTAACAPLRCWAQSSSAAAGQSTPSGSSPRAIAIHADLDRILSGPEFSLGPTAENPVERFGNWLREKWNAFWEWLEKFFRFGGRASPGTAKIFLWVVLCVLIVAIAFVLAYAVRKYGGKTWLGREAPRARREADEPAEETISDPDRLLETARDLAAAGEFRRAYRAVFLAMLLRMDRAGLIRFDRSSTNGEYLRVLRARPDVFASMRPVANDFDLHWYGGKAVGEPDYRRMLGAYEQLSVIGN
jgi:hypothetical protein